MFGSPLGSPFLLSLDQFGQIGCFSRRFDEFVLEQVFGARALISGFAMSTTHSSGISL